VSYPSDPSWQPWQPGQDSEGEAPDRPYTGRSRPPAQVNGHDPAVPHPEAHPPRPRPEGPVPRPWSGVPGGHDQPVWPGAHHPPHHPWHPRPAPPMLASHADRERAVDVLRAGYGEGRLEKAEFDRRVGQVYASRTVDELAGLVGDLPLGPVPHPAPAVPVPQTFRPAPRAGTNGKAAGALVCGLLCVPTFGLTCIPAVVLGHMARSELRTTGESGEGLATTGLVLGWIYTGGWTLLMALLVLAGLVTG
jgi:hypothetical protein